MSKELLTERVQFLSSPSQVDAIEDFRFKHRINTKGEAIRQLIELGLKHAPKEKKK